MLVGMGWVWESMLKPTKNWHVESWKKHSNWQLEIGHGAWQIIYVGSGYRE